MIVDILKKGSCCGCSACYHSCPTKAITMAENANGFLTAKIDLEKCINCNVCDSVCSVKNQSKTQELKCYALKMKDNEQLMKSQSGGAFQCIAKAVLTAGGVVYGVSDRDIKNIHTERIDNLENLEELLKSKYVQSDSTASFPLVKEDLENGRTVLYSGTACVIQGLKNYLEHNKVSCKTLLTCDLICHGVPSRLIESDYISYMEKKENAKLVSLVYRDKSLGWGTHKEKYVFDNGKIKHTNDKVIVFSKGFALSEACFQCKFTYPNRVADITIGDFWPLARIGLSKEQFESGLSVCLVRNTYIDGIIQNLISEKEIEATEIELEDAMQWNLEKPSVRPEKYEQFWEMYHKNRFATLKPVYYCLNFKEKAGRMIKTLLKRI